MVMQSYGWNLQRLQHSRNAVIDNGVCRKELVALEAVRIVFVDEVFAIEKPGSQLNVYKLASSGTAPSDQQPLSQSLTALHWSPTYKLCCDVIKLSQVCRKIDLQ